jgi:hypothetical protein
MHHGSSNPAIYNRCAYGFRVDAMQRGSSNPGIYNRCAYGFRGDAMQRGVTTHYTSVVY